MPRVKTAVSRERELAVLAFLCDRSKGPEGVVVSIEGIAGETGLTYSQARAALQRLVRADMVSIDARSYPNGASAENAYRPTKTGLSAFAAAGGIGLQGEGALK